MQRLLAPRPQRHCIAIERNFVRGFNLICKMLLDLALRDRRRQQDAALGCGACELGDRDIGRARQCGGLIHGGAAAIGEHKTAVAPVARNAIRKRECEHDSGGGFFVS